MQYRIRALRNKLGLTQEEFGGRLGLGRTALSKIESGIVEASQKHNDKCCAKKSIQAI